MITIITFALNTITFALLAMTLIHVRRARRAMVREHAANLEVYAERDRQLLANQFEFLDAVEKRGA